MLERLALGAFLLMLVAMIAAYAMQVAKSQPEPRQDEPVGRMYS